ncbi:MAG TPA: fibronectin type III domain-containing protein, partial [Candidatus Eisenbacteria bacterium]
MSTEIHGWRGLALLLTTLIAIGCDSDSNPDVEAPGAVDDLLVVARGDTAAFLTWTARGDDGNDGRAAAYDIRYSLENLTATSFDSAIAILSPPMPGMSGDPDSVVIAGLLPDRTYFFGLRSTDEVGNLSDLSNIDSLRTPASPDTMAADVT